MKRILLPCLLLLSCVTAKAQWSGSVDMSGGYGGVMSVDEETRLQHWLGGGTFRLAYKTPKFQWNTTLGSSYERVSTEVERISSVITDNQIENAQLSCDLKSKLTNPWTLSFRSDFIWTPSALTRHRAWVLYGYRKESGENLTTQDSGVNSFKDNTGVYFDMPLTKTHDAEVGYDVSRRLREPDRILGGSVSVHSFFKDQQTQWLVYEDKADSPEILSIYAITPQSARTEVKMQAYLKDSVFTSSSVPVLLNTGIRLSGSLTRDLNSGATLISRDPVVWQDSTSLREDFSFLTMLAEPYLQADFKWKDITFHADYGIQLYSRRLSSDLHPKSGLDFVRPSLVGNSRVEWKVSPGHTLTLGSTSSVKHPDYLQICWYERQGTYLTQIYRGSTSLRSTRTHGFNLGYKYQYKRFSATLTAKATRRLGEIDQTYNNEDIGGKTYQVFTWVNASDSWILGLEPRLVWVGKYIHGNLGANMNQSFLKSRSTGEVKKTHDWGITGGFSVLPGKGWSVVADVKYHSSVSSFFTSFSEYWTLNVKVQKAFKHITLYLQGRDLLDHPVSTEFNSADGMQYWREESRLNRRLIVLGGNWKF